MAPYNLVDGSNNCDKYVASIFIINYLTDGTKFAYNDID
jgi:hypothetical protein